MFSRLFCRQYFEPGHRSSLAAEVGLLRRYSASDRARVLGLANDFLNAKVIEGAGEFEVDDDMRRLIAVQACVPILNLGLDYYRGWYSVVVYPGGFRVSREYVDDAGVVHASTQDLSGECWDRGPVILSWDDVEAEAGEVGGFRNVVIHEFAHKLDLLNGTVNGMPPLHDRMEPAAWARHFTRAYERFCESLDYDEEVPFDDYGATSPGEFFAVASEAFFTRPGPVSVQYPDVYDMLRRYYRQDPLAVKSGREDS